MIQNVICLLWCGVAHGVHPNNFTGSPDVLSYWAPMYCPCTAHVALGLLRYRTARGGMLVFPGIKDMGILLHTYHMAGSSSRLLSDDPDEWKVLLGECRHT